MSRLDRGTLREFAAALKVPTAALAVRPDADQADTSTVDTWQSVRRARLGLHTDSDPATADGVSAAIADLMPLFCGIGRARVVGLGVAGLKDSRALRRRKSRTQPCALPRREV